MIDKNDLKDWLAESERKESEKKIEEYIDRQFKSAVLNGKTTFKISTGRCGERTSEKTPFYKIWFNKELSSTNRSLVQKRILAKYREAGFEVNETSVDCGWNNSYPALEFKDVDKNI